MRPPRKPSGPKRPPGARPFGDRQESNRSGSDRPQPAGRPKARGPQRDGRDIRATGGPGKPARPERTQAKRAAPPVRETEVTPQRIAKALARAGVGSRRDIERMIAEGRIAINGEPLTSPALNITSLKGITVDGQPVAGIAPAQLYRFHKPAGFLTTARDPAGRPTIMDILPPGLPRVVPVGRLDMNTEGLLLLTTDGELKRALELPASDVPRVYRVRAFGEVSQKALESLADGITIDGIHYGPILADIERRMGHNLWLIVTIREGKNREVRRVLEHVGLQVNRLIRIAYGNIGLDDLPPRMADEVPAGDLQALKAMLRPARKERG
jgi:23S rRNA pseudouridine2605 synthase